jgi:hypothetical protein
MTAKNIFVHHVYFYLKNPSNSQDLQALLAGLDKLSKARSIKMFHIGKPAATIRDVIQRSYAVSWMLIFEGPEGEAEYQVDPLHLNFVKTCDYLWEKVVIYDSVDA